jgi:hypothetical protein
VANKRLPQHPSARVRKVRRLMLPVPSDHEDVRQGQRVWKQDGKAAATAAAKASAADCRCRRVETQLASRCTHTSCHFCSVQGRVEGVALNNAFVVDFPSVILKSARDVSRDCSGGGVCVCVCVCVFVFSKTAFPLSLKVLHRCTTHWRDSVRLRVLQPGLLRCLGGGITRAQGLLSRFDCVYSGYITRGGAGGALVGC